MLKKKKMKFNLCVVIMVTVTILLDNVKISNSSSAPYCNIWEVKNGDFNSDVHYKPFPRTQEGKCVYECLLRERNMLDANGLINADKFVRFLERSEIFTESAFQNVQTAINNCKLQSAEDRCETVGLFIKCSSEEVSKLGSSAGLIAQSIRMAYFRKDLAAFL